MKEETIHIRVSEVVKRKAKKLASEDGRTLSNWILSLVERELSNQTNKVGVVK